jgi:hypothetical protein
LPPPPSNIAATLTDVCRDIGLGDAERTVHFGIRYPNKAAVLDLIARNQASAGRAPA